MEAASIPRQPGIRAGLFENDNRREKLSDESVPAVIAARMTTSARVPLDGESPLADVTSLGVQQATFTDR
jgi:hypothetical protein